MRKKGFTLIELLVVISIIAMLLAILMPALSKVKRIAQRVICATNLKGMGTAQMVYANDYDDDYAVAGGKAPLTWSDSTDFWQEKTPDLSRTAPSYNITVGASLFLLVREADVGTKSFVCPSGDEKEFSGENTATPVLDLVELWDFGPGGFINATTPDEGPIKCVSYSYQMPYSGHAANGTSSASMVMMADKSPFFDDKLANVANTNDEDYLIQASLLPTPTNNDWEDGFQKWELQAANANSHGREGQNMLFGDGHASFEKRADVGIQNDNIYVPWGATPPTSITEEHRRKGLLPSARDLFRPEHDDDSVLVNDETRFP